MAAVEIMQVNDMQVNDMAALNNEEWFQPGWEQDYNPHVCGI